MKVTERSLKQRKAKDIFRDSGAYLFSLFGVLILALIIFFVFDKGHEYLSWKFLTSDYYTTNTTVSYDTSTSSSTFENPNIENVYFSSRWGVGLEDGYDNEKNAIIQVTYVDKNSPFNNLLNESNQEKYRIETNSSISTLLLVDDSGSIFFGESRYGAKTLVDDLEKADKISSMIVQTSGGGIRGSLLSTLYMIFFTLLFALPIGILTAVYLSLIAKQNKVTNLFRTLIDLASGIPTIIFGLVGAIIFIPFVALFTQKSNGSLLSGSLTLALMLLPIIINTTEEAIKTVPKSYKEGSLALGASNTQTIFKVVLPNALPGILTAILLSIGRIIGESAALIYSMGTTIKDHIILSEASATLALHIYKLVAFENPNFGAASAISIIILIVDLILNLIVKLLSYRFLKKFKR